MLPAIDGFFCKMLPLVDPRRACVARVTVLCVCVRVCRSVCLLSHISPLDHIFVLKILSRTQRAMEVKNLWHFL